jgi:AraC-like DNA-binding protein
MSAIERDATPDDGRFEGGQALAELAAGLARHAPTDGVHATAIDGVHAIRVSRPSSELVFALHQPAVCVIAQGCKRVMLGKEVYAYDASRFLVFSVDLPVSAQVTQATPREPYLCFRLDLHAADIAALLIRTGEVPAPPDAPGRGLYVSRTTEPLLDAVRRLVRLLDEPAERAALAPLVIQEIVYRLLCSDQGHRLAAIARADSHASRIARAIVWLKSNYAAPLRTEALARHAHMSVSSLHHHFKAVTSMSPLQYQKQLRLQEARRLLLGEVSEIAAAAFRVGYESPSQFTREYSRAFGVPPSRDLQRLRSAAATGLRAA